MTAAFRDERPGARSVSLPHRCLAIQISEGPDTFHGDAYRTADPGPSARHSIMNRRNASEKSGCQRDRAGRFSMMSPAAQAMRFSSCARVVSLSGHRM